MTSRWVVHPCENDAVDVGDAHFEHRWAPSQDQNSQLSPAGSPPYAMAQNRAAQAPPLGKDRTSRALPVVWPV
ncbi:hypothetical protein, partial [Actinomyces acetigenes]